MKKIKPLQRVLWTIAAVLAVLAAVLRPVSGMGFAAVLLWAACLGIAVYALLDAASADRAWAIWCKRALLVFVCLGFAFFCYLEAQVIAGARGGRDTRDVSCVVILGAGVDGTQPSLMLARRLDAALTYLADKPEIPVIVSGCQGKGESISEAECMARYLAARGVDETRIRREEKATSTRTNFLFSIALMRERGLDPYAPYAVVSSDFHFARIGYILDDLGLARESIVPVRSTLPCGAYYAAITAVSYVREAFALANEMLLGVDWDL